MKSFIIKLTILTVIAGSSYYSIKPIIPIKFFFPQFQYLLLLFIGVTFIFHLGLKRSFQKGSKYFIRYYMGASGLKMLLFLIIITVFALINKSDAVAFTLCFFFFYLFFTIFEAIISFKEFGETRKKEKELASDSSNI